MNNLSVLAIAILLVFSASNIHADNPAVNTSGSGDVRSGAVVQGNELNRISENGGQVIIDGSLRVLEPIYAKDFDLVETTVPVTPITNHVRLYAVASGTYTVIKALFDDGTTKTVTNN